MENERSSEVEPSKIETSACDACTWMVDRSVSTVNDISNMLSFYVCIIRVGFFPAGCLSIFPTITIKTPTTNARFLGEQ
jgi:hypothetical protein